MLNRGQNAAILDYKAGAQNGEILNVYTRLETCTSLSERERLTNQNAGKFVAV